MLEGAAHQQKQLSSNSLTPNPSLSLTHTQRMQYFVYDCLLLKGMGTAGKAEQFWPAHVCLTVLLESSSVMQRDKPLRLQMGIQPTSLLPPLSLTHKPLISRIFLQALYRHKLLCSVHRNNKTSLSCFQSFPCDPLVDCGGTAGWGHSFFTSSSSHYL